MRYDINSFVPWDDSCLKDYEGMLIQVVDCRLRTENDFGHLGISTIVANKSTKNIYSGAGAMLAANALEHPDQFPQNDPQSQLKKDYDDDTVELILSGRLKMLILLRSPGGRQKYCKYIHGAVDHVKKNGGTIETISSELVGSSAAILATQAEPSGRIISDQTCMMFHKASHAKLRLRLWNTMLNLIGRGRNHTREFDEFIAVESRNVPKKYQSTFAEKISHSKDTSRDNTVAFSSNELIQFGMAREQRSLTNLGHYVEQSTGISVGQKQSHQFNPLSRYFLISETTARIRELLNLQPGELALSLGYQRNTGFTIKSVNNLDDPLTQRRLKDNVKNEVRKAEKLLNSMPWDT